MKYFFKNKSAGFLTVEVLIVIFIITGAVLASMGVAQKAVAVSRQALHSNQAAFLLEEGAEALRVLRDNNWTNISNLGYDPTYYLYFDAGTWNINTTANTVGIFTRSIKVFSVHRDSTTGDIVASGGVEDPDARLVVVTVTWPEGDTTKTKTLSFYLFNIFS